MTIDDEMPARHAEYLERSHYEREAFADTYGQMVEALEHAKANNPLRTQPVSLHPAFDDPSWRAGRDQVRVDTGEFTDRDWTELARRQRADTESEETERQKWLRRFASSAADPLRQVTYAPRVGQRGRRVSVDRGAE